MIPSSFPDYRPRQAVSGFQALSCSSLPLVSWGWTRAGGFRNHLYFFIAVPLPASSFSLPGSHCPHKNRRSAAVLRFCENLPRAPLSICPSCGSLFFSSFPPNCYPFASCFNVVPFLIRLGTLLDFSASLPLMHGSLSPYFPFPFSPFLSCCAFSLFLISDRQGNLRCMMLFFLGSLFPVFTSEIPPVTLDR